ncbi:hypothetical protein CKAH01_03874 [Colletotrichum kahawae]|uniref:Uncharacterized protein n=1 Tax=Colletotrichum kahawae TaxID=34407 RepID=A0AAE0DBF9_COLKA|nr:hypothetical protein CKAH01_03874 [Colletotrichum kahawae]
MLIARDVGLAAFTGPFPVLFCFDEVLGGDQVQFYCLELIGVEAIDGSVACQGGQALPSLVHLAVFSHHGSESLDTTFSSNINKEFADSTAFRSTLLSTTSEDFFTHLQPSRAHHHDQPDHQNTAARMEQASQPRELQAPNSRIRRAVSRPWDFLRAHLRPVCQYVRRQFNRHSAADDAARTLARRKAHLQILQANFHPDVVKSLQETPWLAAQLAAGEDTWDESQRTFPDRVASHVLLRLQMHNLNFVERTQINRPARSVRHLESIMELVVVDEVARKMAAGMREAWWDPEGVVRPNYWWVFRHKTVAEWLRAMVEKQFS